MKHVCVILELLLLCAALSSCTVKPPEITVTGEKTILERQLLGEYELSPKSIFLPAVSGGIYAIDLADTTGGVPSPDIEVQSDRKEYLIALANHRFNIDDIEAFKDLGVIGENNRGYLHLFEEKTSQLSAADDAVLKAVVEEENRGRRIIMLRVIKLRAELSEENLPEIEEIFAQRSIEDEKPGRFVQTESNEWTIKQ